MLIGTKVVIIYYSANIMEKKLKVVRFIPAIVIKFTGSGNQFLETSCCCYEDLYSAREALSRLVDIYAHYNDCNILRSSVIRKVIEL